MSDLRFAPKGTIWVCAACGKTHKDRYGEDGEGDLGWDESCMLKAVLCEEGTYPWIAVDLHASAPAEKPAKPKDAEGLKIGSRLTVDGVEAVVVPVEPPVEVFERLDRSGAVEREAPHYLTDEDMAVVWRHAIAMLSAAGDGR